jgi:hypothetical protein
MAYGKVEENFYSRSEVRRLSFFGKSVLIYLLVNHHRNFIGLYFLPHSYAVEDLDITLQQYKDALAEIIGAGLAFYDENEKTIFVAINLEHNPINSEKQIKGAINLIKDIRSVRLLEEFAKRNPIDTLLIPIRNRIDTLSIPYGKGMQGVPIEEEEKEEVKVNKKEEQKTTPPHNSKTDDKTEVKHYTDKIIYNEDVRKFRNKRFVELADKLPPDEVSQLVNLESERLFVLREEAA